MSELKEGSPTISIIVVDDHAIWRGGVQSLLQDSEFQVIGEAGSGNEALELLKTLSPDIVLLDIRMEDGDGLSTLQAIKRAYPKVQVIMLTTYDNASYIAKAASYGASGYVLKGVGEEELLGSIRAVVRGECLIDAQELSRTLRRISPEGQESAELIKPLSEREAEILRLLATGLPNSQIASQLFISVGTVKTHVEHIINKLGVSDRIQAVVWALRNGLIPEE